MTKRRLITTALMIVLSLGLFAACSANTAYPGTGNIIEASDVIAQKDQAVIVDARGKEAYDNGHMAGAISLSPGAVTVEEPVKGTLAPKEQVEQVLGAAGISSDSTVYIYDDNAGVSAGRLWWVMTVYGHEKVMIVNGGSAALVRAGAELSAEATALTPTTYVAKEARADMLADFEMVKALSEAPQEGTVLLDVRSPAEYAEGYIPGAVLYPHTQNVYKDGTFMSPRDIKLFYQDAGITPDQTLILYCKSSFRATQAAAVLQEAGFDKVKIYDGAWLEWEQRMDTSAPAEETAPVTPADGS